MNCQEYRDLIEDALDVSLHGEPERRVRLHLEHCASCRDYFKVRQDEHVALFSGINAACEELRLSEGFADRLAESVRNRRSARRGWRRLALPRWALIAASVAAMLGFAFANVKLIMENVKLEEGEREGAKATEGMKETEGAEATIVEVADATAIAPSVSSVPLASSEPSESSSPSTQTTDPQLETNQKGETLMSKVKAATAALTAAMAAAPLAAANGDEYQFIDPTTYPAENVSYSARSSAVTVDAGALRIAGAPDDLEARSRTRGASAAILLDATKFHGSVLFVL